VVWCDVVSYGVVWCDVVRWDICGLGLGFTRVTASQTTHDIQIDYFPGVAPYQVPSTLGLVSLVNTSSPNLDTTIVVVSLS